MKTIKIIELLNKIANGEELPKKFKMLSPVLREEIIFTYSDIYNAYFSNDNSPISMNLSDNLKNLNEEIEIIEDDEKIEYLDKNKTFEYGEITHQAIINMQNKINEIIDYINKEEK